MTDCLPPDPSSKEADLLASTPQLKLPDSAPPSPTRQDGPPALSPPLLCSLPGSLSHSFEGTPTEVEEIIHKLGYPPTVVKLVAQYRITTRLDLLRSLKAEEQKIKWELGYHKKSFEESGLSSRFPQPSQRSFENTDMAPPCLTKLKAKASQLWHQRRESRQKASGDTEVSSMHQEAHGLGNMHRQTGLESTNPPTESINLSHGINQAEGSVQGVNRQDSGFRFSEELHNVPSPPPAPIDAIGNEALVVRQSIEDSPPAPELESRPRSSYSSSPPREARPDPVPSLRRQYEEPGCKYSAADIASEDIAGHRKRLGVDEIEVGARALKKSTSI